MKNKLLSKIVSLILTILVISASIPLEVFASTDASEKINSGTLFEASTLDDLQLNITQLPTITVNGTEKYTVNISDTLPITIGGINEIRNENIIFDCGFDKKLDAEIKVEFLNCGTLNSKPIDMILTYSDIYSAPETGTARYDTKCFWWTAYGNKEMQTDKNEWFEVGFGRYNLDVKFYYSESNSPIYLENAYLTLYSEDGVIDDNGNITHTEASCGNNAASNCYLYDNTNMLYCASWNLFEKQYSNAYYGTKGGSTGAKDKNAVCWQFKDRSSINLDMMIGYGLWSMGYHLNFIPLTASIPNAPIKTVSKSEATDKTELQYSIQQFMPKAYDKNFKLQSFEINDVLEDSVNYISAKIIDNNSNDITASAGVLSYDKATRKISYKFNEDYLSNISYEGQNVTMKINVVTKENTDVREIKNTASVSINNVTLNSNTVQTNIYYPLTVNYLDEQGNSLADSIISDCFVGDDYSTKPKDIEDYVLIQTPNNANGTITNSAVTVDYIYKLQDTNVIVNYIDTNGAKLAESINIEGKINDTYTTESKEFYGYKLTKMPSNTSGIMANDVITVNYVYTLKDTSVTVNYIDENGNPLTNSETISGKVFDKYKTENKSFYGYELIAVPDNASGEMTVEPTEVNYIYRIKCAKVEIYYVDTEENSIANIDTLTGNVFEKYFTKPKEIHGYSLLNEPDNANGEFQEETIKVVYIYSKEDLAEKSPKTGSEYNDFYIILALSAFSITISFIFYRIRNKYNNS